LWSSHRQSSSISTALYYPFLKHPGREAPYLQLTLTGPLSREREPFLQPSFTLPLESLVKELLRWKTVSHETWGNTVTAHRAPCGQKACIQWDATWLPKQRLCITQQISIILIEKSWQTHYHVKARVEFITCAE
jgi:hypothetical protein